MRLTGLPVALLLLLSPAASLQADGALQVSDAWIREAPPGASVLAGYLTLTNTGPAPVVVEAVSSTEFGAVEIHTSWIEDGIARMQPLSTLSIPPHATIQLEPGGRHLMLFRPVRQLAEGDTATLLLQQADGVSVSVAASVRRQQQSPAHHH